MMNNLSTPGKRLRYFARTFFVTISAFARQMGYRQSGSLYDYFIDTKLPGARFQDRFRQLGGNPYWLRYGAGSMFADNEAGRKLNTQFRASRILDDRVPGTEKQPAAPLPGAPERTLVPYLIDRQQNGDDEEELYLLMNRVFFKMKSRRRIAGEVLQMYREVLDNIRQEIDRVEQYQEIVDKVAGRHRNRDGA